MSSFASPVIDRTRPSSSSPGPAGRCRRVGAALALIGLATALIGTFGPWLKSGGVVRDSYAAAGIAGRLGLAGSGFRLTALSWWPLLGPLAALAVVAAILSRWRTAGLVTLVFAVITGGVAGSALIFATGTGAAGLEPAYPGPIVTAAGALLSGVGAILVIAAAVGPRRHRHRNISDTTSTDTTSSDTEEMT